MEARMTERLRQVEADRRASLVQAIGAAQLPGVPVQALQAGEGVGYAPVMGRREGQTDASVEEQAVALRTCVETIDRYVEQQAVVGEREFVKSVLLQGPPGSGKTRVLITAMAYGLSRGVNVILTSLTSERARALGGEHIHLLFALPVIEGQAVPMVKIAEEALG